jgi:type IV secretion system protein TrbL
MVRSRGLELTFVVIALVLVASAPALAQQGSVLTTLENQVVTAARGWETTVMNAARSLFWILAGIEIGIAAVWLALQAASLDTWFAELVRRIMFIGLFAFILDRGPAFAKAVVDSLFQIGANGGSASPANIFDAGIRVASKMSEQAKFGLFEDNALAIAAVFAMVVVVVSFSLVAAIFVAVMVEMYVGLLAGMIMLGLGGSSYTKDFAIRYLIYAFSGLCRKLEVEMQKGFCSVFMRLGFRTVRQVTVRDCARTSPVVSASFEPFQCPTGYLLRG